MTDIHYPYRGRLHPLWEHPGYETYDKFGNNPAVGTGGQEDIWDYGGDLVYPTTGVGLSISSSAAADTQEWEVEGLGWPDKTVRKELVSCNGQTKKDFGGLFWRVFRCQNMTETAAVGDVYIYQNTEGTVTAGVPQTASLVMAMVTIGAEQTGMATFTVKKGKRAFLRHLHAYANLSATPATAADANLFLLMRLPGYVWKVKKWFGVSSTGGTETEMSWDVPFPDFDAMPEYSEIRVRGIASGKALDISIDFQLEMVDM